MEQTEIGQVNDVAICFKEMLTSREAARYLGVSRDCLLKLMRDEIIPFCHVRGELFYFNRRELEKALMNFRIPSEFEAEAMYGLMEAWKKEAKSREDKE